MKKLILFIAIILTTISFNLFSQVVPEVEAYLITCGPGTEVYSIYGHSALRIYNRELKTDLVYNWGVFDFSTTHFIWKFAKGKLNYMLAEDSYKRFLQEYLFDKRWVQIQKINLDPAEVEQLITLINENLKPENRNYRYNFYYDDCSTRIRDLFEKILGNRLIYPLDETKDRQSFRNLTGSYQQFYPWLNFGIDLVIGTPGDKKAHFRDKMFLPIEMQRVLSKSLVNSDGKMIPLLRNPENILEYEAPVVKTHFYLAPVFIFSLILIAILLFFALNRRIKANKTVDIFIFSIYSILSLLMIFFNFITNHEQTKKNLNIIWLSPIIIICLLSIILNKKWYIWFKIVFILCLISFFIQIIFQGAFNSAFIPLIMILLIRSSARAGFSWNPLSVDNTF
ncbi:MAG: DUF4105 domain-containing protein [Bacteroidia bacterium]|nr:DUF4105 domain-containing protein [Bacteroidia bacterium]